MSRRKVRLDIGNRIAGQDSSFHCLLYTLLHSRSILLGNHPTDNLVDKFKLLTGVW